MSITPRFFLVLATLLLAACSSVSPRPAPVERPSAAEKPALPSTLKGGGYYKDDGPGDNPPPNLDAVPDAIPRLEPLHRFANKPYTVLGQSYAPLARTTAYRESGVASWYGRKFHGQKTSSGEPYDMYGMTAAHRILPIPSYVRVTNLANNRSVIVRVNDRGPFHSDRVIDLSYTAAHKLDIIRGGSSRVEVEILDPSATPLLAARTTPQSNEATPSETAVTASTDAGHVYLQLGAFSLAENAEHFRARLKLEMSHLADVFHIFNAEGLFRVRAGPFRSQADALQAANEIRQAMNVTAIVMPR